MSIEEEVKSLQTRFSNLLRRALLGDIYLTGKLGGPGVSWQDYDAAISGATGTAGSYTESTNDAIGRYCRIGNVCFLKVQKMILDKGSWSGGVLLALPFAPANLGVSSVLQVTPCWWANASAATDPKAITRWVAGSNQLTFVRAINLSLFQWVNVAVDDWLFLQTAYEIQE